MSLVDVATLRTLVETDLGDPALQLLLDDADAEIIARLGVVGAQQEVIRSVGDLYMHLGRRATEITAVVERVFVGWGNPMEFSLQPNDYKLHADGYRVERCVAGSNPSTVWRGMVTFSYTPVDQTAQRKRLEVDLVKLALNYQGHLMLTAGDVRVTRLSDYNDERAALFRSLQSQGRRLIT